MGIIIGISIFIAIMGMAFWKYGFHPGTDEFKKFREKIFHEFYDKEDDKEKKK